MTMTTAEEQINNNESSSSSVGKKSSSSSEDENTKLDDSQNGSNEDETTNNKDNTDLKDDKSEKNEASDESQHKKKTGAVEKTKGKKEKRKTKTTSRRRRRQRDLEDSSSSSSGDDDDEEEDEEADSSSSSSSESSAENVDVAKLQVMARRRIARAKSERFTPEKERNSSYDTGSSSTNTSSGLLSRLSLSFNASHHGGSNATDDGDNLLLMGLTKKVQRLEKEKKDLQNANADQEAAHMAKIKALESGTDLEETRSQLKDARERIKTLEDQQAAWAQQVADLEKKLHDRQATIDQLRIEHPAPGVEPNVYRDLREEVAAAHSLIKSQSEHIEKLSSYASFQHENESKDLHTRVSELEMELAKSELVWKEKISKNSQDYRKQIDHWKVQANNWKIRFEQVWSDHHQGEQSKAGNGDLGRNVDPVIDASTTNTTTTSPGSKGSLTSDSGTPTSAEDQARFLAAAMGKPNALLKRGWGWG